MSRQPCLRDRWRTEVMRSHLITDSTRVVLLFLADSMAANGYVSVPRSEIAEALNRAPRRITERIELAREAGFLDTVTKGRPGRTAEYRACIPTDGMVRPSAPSDDPGSRSTYGAVSSTHSGAPVRTTQHGADGGPANTRARSNAGERSERVAVHDPAGSEHADVVVLDGRRCVARFEQLHSTMTGRARLTSVVEAPLARESAQRHDLSRWSRLTGLSPGSGRRVACAGLRGAAA